MVQRLLILGGSSFVGPAVIDDALARGWDVTVLNRGTQPAPAGVTSLTGDRTSSGGLAALHDGIWDVVVDTWASAPSAVRDAAAVLVDRVDRYVYVSSRSVYRWPMPAGGAEDLPTCDASPDDGDVDYQRAKRGGELAALAAFGDRALFARAGLILGPREDIGRLPWWLHRIARGGPVLAPGPADNGVQFIDARDLAAFVLDAAEHGFGGPYDVVSPVGHASMRDVLEACVAVTDSDEVLVARSAAGFRRGSSSAKRARLASRSSKIASITTSASPSVRPPGSALVWLRVSVAEAVRRARLDIGLSSGAGDAPYGITPREHEVLGLLVEGATTRGIARQLFISAKTRRENFKKRAPAAMTATAHARSLP